MSLEQLEYWIERLKPPPLIKGVSMLDGYLTAIIVGPCTIDPYEWMRHMLGPHSTVGSDGSEQFAAMQAIAARFNAIGEGLATAPSQYGRSLSAPRMALWTLAPGAWGSWRR